MPKSTLTVLLRLAVTRSGLPSPLTSATASAYGLVPATKFCAGWNVPLPLPRSTLTEELCRLAASRSGLPSPLMSATATANGLESVVKLTGARRLGTVRSSRVSSHGR